jgi:hypothetical protein
MNELPDEKAQLCKYVFWELKNGKIKLSPRQIGSPWDWVFKTESVVRNGEITMAYTLAGVKIPADGEFKSHTFMLDQIRI